VDLAQNQLILGAFVQAPEDVVEASCIVRIPDVTQDRINALSTISAILVKIHGVVLVIKTNTLAEDTAWGRTSTATTRSETTPLILKSEGCVSSVGACVEAGIEAALAARICI
jgi:hypothetical protein